MVEVPKELRKFNIHIHYCGTQPDTHQFLVKRIAKQILEEEGYVYEDLLLPPQEKTNNVPTGTN